MDNKDYIEKLQLQNDELKALNASLQEAVSRSKVFFEKGPVPYAITDTDGLIIDCNLKFRETFEHAGQGDPISKNICSDYQDGLHLLMTSLINGEATDEMKDGIFGFIGERPAFYFKTSASLIEFDSRETLLWSFVDVSQDMAYLDEVTELTFKDQLTDLYNRRYFQEELNRLDNDRNLAIGLIMLDVNGLKTVNDVFGHMSGDRLLKAVAATLKSLCRRGEIIARLGGDEFVIVVPAIEQADFDHLVHRIEAGCREIRIDGMLTSVSVGAAMKKRPNEPMVSVLKSAEEKMYRNKLAMSSSYHRLQIDSIVEDLYEKHPEEKGHSQRVSGLMVHLANRLGLDERNIKKYEMIGLFHDIGKAAIDYSVIDKGAGEPLTEENWQEIQRHPESGFRLLKVSEDFLEILDAVLHHHERMDGSGYPMHIKGKEISRETRALCICDAFDAMISERPYREKLTWHKALEELKANAGTQFDADLVDAFVEMVVSGDVEEG